MQLDTVTKRLVDNYTEDRSYHYRHVTPRLEHQEVEDLQVF